MEAIIVLGLIVLLIVIITGNSRLQAQVRNLESEMIALQRQLKEVVTGKPEKTREDIKTAHQYWAPPQEEKPAAAVPPIKPIAPDLSAQPPVPKPDPLPVHKPLSISPSPSLVPPPPPRPSFFERNPDLEKFIGENLISKIGIAILVIGIGFFVKYAIDQEWIGPAGRVAIGVLCGGILIGLAHKLQQNYKAFSSVLVGGGLAVLYFSIALAYKDYGLFSQTVAFMIMVVITIFAIVLSLLYDRQEVAIIALAGGFGVPFMVSNGSGNYVTLFTYLLLLNTGLLVIAYRKGWRLLNLLAFIATVLLFVGWLGTIPPGTPGSIFLGGLGFATAFYLLFLAINLAHNIREREKFIASDFGILLAVNCLYFSAGLYLLYAAGAGQYKGLFSASLGILNFALTALLIRRRNIDSTILYLLVGITLTFVSLTAPLQLEGHSITLFWAAESVVLLWLFQKSKIRVLQWGLMIVWVCSILSLILDWFTVYGELHDASKVMAVLANRGFMTTLFVAATNTALYRLILREGADAPFSIFDRAMVARGLGSVAVILLYAAGALEIGYQFHHRYPGISIGGLYLQLYTFAFVLLLWILSRRGIIRVQWMVMAALMGLCLVYYLIGTVYAYAVQGMMLRAGSTQFHFIAHWLSAALIVVIFWQVVQVFRARRNEAHYVFINWVGAAFAVIFVSIEIHLLTNAIAFDSHRTLGEIARSYGRVGLPIIWGLCSFTMMWLGMKHKYRPLRIASLALFTITLLKLFLFDIRGIGAGGKIAAFLCLGVLLLVVSFMYQRLKRLIIEDERKKDAI